MSVEEIVRAARTDAVVFEGTGRGLLEVRGEDRVRWLDGMISADVNALVERGAGAGCYATLLTNRGAIVADLHVACFEERLVLESLAAEIARIAATLDRFVIADDVTLVDRSGDFEALAIEGPRAAAIVASALGDAAGDGGAAPSPEDWVEGAIGGEPVRVGAFGFTGEPSFQIFVRNGAGARVLSGLDAAAGGPLVRGSAEALEILRVEAGVPLLGRELDEEVLPPEARLERAISTTKGCYVGQEIVARLRARGQVNHLLVGLALGDVDALPAPGTRLEVDGRSTGELTSVVRSPSLGPIALGYVRREHAEPGTRLVYSGGALGRASSEVAGTGGSDERPGGEASGAPGGQVSGEATVEALVRAGSAAVAASGVPPEGAGA